MVRLRRIDLLCNSTVKTVLEYRHVLKVRITRNNKRINIAAREISHLRKAGYSGSSQVI